MLLSKKEDKAYRTLKEHGFVVFKIKDLQLLLHLKTAEAYNLIKSLKKKGAIRKISSFFTFHDTEEFALGSNIHYPSYISFWSALNYYGWSDQTPRDIFLATTKYKRNVASFKYITLSRKRFFGYIKIGGFAIADKEKTIIDTLLFPKYAGGMREIKISLENALKELNKEKLISYALKVESRVVARRLGFLLESLGYKRADKLKNHIGKGYELFDPSLKKKNVLNKKWLLDMND